MWPQNRLAWWLWERWELVGPAVLDLVDLALSPRDAEALLTKLAFLIGLARAHRAGRAHGGSG